MMRGYTIRDEAGNVLGTGCGPHPPTGGDIAVVREFAQWLQQRKRERRKRCTCTHHSDGSHTELSGCEWPGCPCEATEEVGE